MSDSRLCRLMEREKNVKRSEGEGRAGVEAVQGRDRITLSSSNSAFLVLDSLATNLSSARLGERRSAPSVDQSIRSRPYCGLRRDVAELSHCLRATSAPSWFMAPSPSAGHSDHLTCCRTALSSTAWDLAAGPGPAQTSHSALYREFLCTRCRSSYTLPNSDPIRFLLSPRCYSRHVISSPASDSR